MFERLLTNLQADPQIWSWLFTIITTPLSKQKYSNIKKKKEYMTGRGVNRHKGICYSSDVVQNFNSLTGTCNWINGPFHSQRWPMEFFHTIPLHFSAERWCEETRMLQGGIFLFKTKPAGVHILRKVQWTIGS